MPTGKSLLKISKQLKKSKGPGFAVHPKSRKFGKLNKASLREDKIEKKKALHLEKREHELKRLLFFQEAAENRVSEDKKSFTLEEVKVFIEAYISRFDDELKVLIKQRRPGRPATKRQDLLQDQKSKDINEYATGFYVPALNDSVNVENLINWNGTIGGVTNVKFHHLARDATIFPDQGQSADTVMS